MPTPVGHVLSGALLYSALSMRRTLPKRLFLFTLLWAVLPDIDFLFGFWVGNPNRYHHQFTHSLVFVIILGFVGAALLTKNNRTQFWLYFVCLSAAGVLHLTLDLLAVDTRAPYGAPIFWPFSGHYFISPIRIFSDVHRASDSGAFFKSLFNWHNARTVGIEMLILGPLTVWSYWFMLERRKENAK